jgi:hypothetical protein
MLLLFVIGILQEPHNLQDSGRVNKHACQTRILERAISTIADNKFSRYEIKLGTDEALCFRKTPLLEIYFVSKTFVTHSVMRCTKMENVRVTTRLCISGYGMMDPC